MDEQRFHRATHAVAPRLRVVRNADRFPGIGPLVDVHMTVAVEMLDDRDFRFGRDPRDQALAAARHDHVDEFRHRHQDSDRRAIGGRENLHGIFRQAGRAQSFEHAGADREIGLRRFRPAAQDGGIAGF